MQTGTWLPIYIEMVKCTGDLSKDRKPSHPSGSMLMQFKKKLKKETALIKYIHHSNRGYESPWRPAVPYRTKLMIDAPLFWLPLCFPDAMGYLDETGITGLANYAYSFICFPQMHARYSINSKKVHFNFSVWVQKQTENSGTYLTFVHLSQRYLSQIIPTYLQTAKKNPTIQTSTVSTSNSSHTFSSLK